MVGHDPLGVGMYNSLAYKQCRNGRVCYFVGTDERMCNLDVYRLPQTDKALAIARNTNEHERYEVRRV